MKVTKSYLKQVIKEELEHMEEGGVAIGSKDDEVAKLGYDKEGPNYATQTGMLKAVSDHAVYSMSKALQALQAGDSSRAEYILNDALEYIDTKITGLDPTRMSPKMNYK